MRIGHAGLSLLLISLAAGTAGCAHASAKTISGSPPLEMPPPPQRVVETVEATPPPPPFPLVEEPARQPVLPPARPATRAEVTPPKPEPPKVEQPPVEPPKVAEEAPKPPTTLQTTPVGAEREVERAIRGVISRATTDLKRVDYRALNTDARTQYDTAKRFIEQAEDALKKRNLVFARNLADKALGLAAQLAGR